MITNGNKKKYAQLGESTGAAVHRLRKMIMFQFAKELGKDVCYQCKHKIENLEDFSVEHKLPWLNSVDPKRLFFDLNNIAFSHLKCNCSASRGSLKYNTAEEAVEGERKMKRLNMKKHYTPEKRSLRYIKTGY